MRKSLTIICFGLMTCLALGVSPSERQQLENFKVSTLKGLPGVAVSVKIVRDTPETLPLLRESDLAGEVELALQAGGIEVLKPAADVGLYIVIVKVAGGGPDSLSFAMHVQSSLLQVVHLSRDSTIKTEAQTWPSVGQARFGLVSVALAKSAITRTVKEQAKEFAANYRAANPKSLTAEHAETLASPNGYAGQAAENTEKK